MYKKYIYVLANESPGQKTMYFKCLDPKKTWTETIYDGTIFTHNVVIGTDDISEAFQFKNEREALNYAVGHLFGDDYAKYRVTRVPG